MKKSPIKLLSRCKVYPATAEPAGTESGAVGVMAGLTRTVPSTNGANPGRNLLEQKKTNERNGNGIKTSMRLRWEPSGEQQKFHIGG